MNKNLAKTRKEIFKEKKKVLFIGNCQTCISQFLLSVPSFENNYQIRLIEVYKPNLLSQEDKININDFDIIITQPILDTFEKFPEYQTKNIIQKLESPHVKFVMFPVCYFDFNFPFLESKDGNYIETNIEKIYKSNLSQFAYYDMVNDINLLDYAIMTYRLNKSFTTLKDREEDANNTFRNMCKRKNILDFNFIYVSDFIKENFRKNLFYTFNHPTKLLLSYISYKILICLGIFNHTNSENIYDYLVFPKKLDPLNAFTPPLYKCFQSFFEINMDEYNKNLSYKGARPCNITKFFRYYICGNIGNHINLKKNKKYENYHLPNKNILYNMMNSNIKKCVAPKKKNNPSSGKSTFIKMTSNIDMNSSSGTSSFYTTQLSDSNNQTPSTQNVDENESPILNNKKSFNTTKKKVLPGKLVKQKSCNSNF